LGERIDALRATVYELLYRYERVVLDLENVHRIDGAGLGVIAGAAAMAVIGGRNLGVAGASGVVDESLTMTRLKTAVDCYSTTRRCAAA
jgi:anti-anti-sigma factor